MKRKSSTQLRRQHLLAVRKAIIGEIQRLEKRYGAREVSGAFARHQQVRRERAKLARAQEEIAARIQKLES